MEPLDKSMCVTLANCLWKCLEVELWTRRLSVCHLDLSLTVSKRVYLSTNCLNKVDIQYMRNVVLYFTALANFHVVLPERSSTQDFFTPNAFPANAEIMWYFTVPHTYYTDVRILSYTVPTCLRPENIPTMKYTWQGKEPLVKLMNVSQPSVEPGNFNLSIKNCRLSGPQPPSQDLMVRFQISAIKRSKGR